MRRIYSLAVLAVSLVFLCGVGFADSTFDFNEGTGNVHNSQDTFTSNGSTLTVYGFTKSDSAADLFLKNGGGDETGLGLDLRDDTDHEIGSGNFIQFTGTGVTSIKIGSVQSGESWILYGSNTLGQLGTKIDSGTTGGSFNVSGNYAFLSLAAGAKGDVLLDSVTTAAAVPEPAMPALILTTGLLGFAEIVRRKLFA